MYCSNCGKKLSEDDFFCSNCGTPVLRQNLFNDSNDDYNDDAFEETRLFTAEELGQFLNDEDDASVNDYYQVSSNQAHSYQYQEPRQAQFDTPAVEQNVPPQESNPASTDKTAAAKEMVSSAVGSANAFVGKFKAKRSEAKAKKIAKKQQEQFVEPELMNAEVLDEETSNGPVPFKKIVLPVVILGLIIGLVFGLILVQPWQNDDDTAVSSIMITEQINQK